MSKKFIYILILFILIPIKALADENNVLLICDKIELNNNEEVNCDIVIKKLDLIVTSFSGKIVTSDNLKIISSSYDNKIWKMLDSEFKVENINLISEEIEKKDEINIATFKMKAKNKTNTIGRVKLEEVVLGDESYESHELLANDLTIDLNYNKEKNSNNLIAIVGLLIIVCLIYIKKKKGKM